MTMTADEQLDFFRHQLGAFVPRATLDDFRRHASRSRTEAEGRKRKVTDPLGVVRAAYHRHAAATSALFPILFVFESAWRTFVAPILSDHYGGDEWWHRVRDAVAQGVPDGSLPLVGKAGSSALSRTIAHIVRRAPDNANRLETTFSLVETATLHDVGELVKHHWSVFAPRMSWPIGGSGPSRDAFDTLFDRVRLARNAAFHHQVVVERAQVLRSAERLLDMIDVHLGSRVEPIVAEEVAPPTYATTIEPRHL